MLDASDLLQLALRDIEATNHEAAIAKLTEASSLESGNAAIHFLLAAEYAETGHHVRAAEGMKHALSLDPELHVARFQLGLIHFTQNELSSAAEAWKPLSVLGDENAFSLFAAALLKLGVGHRDSAIPLLEKALHAEPVIPALRGDIERALNNARNKVSAEAEDDSTASLGDALLHRYRTPDEH
jgi:tetratricopeptide (TPR) repeat protein